MRTALALLATLSACTPSAPPGCCPVSPVPSCGCGFERGGWNAGFGCGTFCDFYGTERRVDEHGCEYWVETTEPCRGCLLAADAWMCGVDGGP